MTVSLLLLTAALTFSFPLVKASGSYFYTTLRFFFAESSLAGTGFILTDYLSLERPLDFDCMSLIRMTFYENCSLFCLLRFSIYSNCSGAIKPLVRFKNSLILRSFILISLSRS
jgi:hypothetical protein